jgi:hypothetical protein
VVQRQRLDEVGHREAVLRAPRTSPKLKLKREVHAPSSRGNDLRQRQSHRGQLLAGPWGALRVALRAVPTPFAEGLDGLGSLRLIAHDQATGSSHEAKVVASSCSAHGRALGSVLALARGLLLGLGFPTQPGNEVGSSESGSSESGSEVLQAEEDAGGSSFRQQRREFSDGTFLGSRVASLTH